MKLWWNCSEDQIWIEERVEELSRGRTRDLKQFASLFSCFCCVNFRKLLRTLQQQWWSCGLTVWRMKSGLRREWRSFQEEELTIWNNLRNCFVVFVMLTVVNCCKRYNRNNEVVVEQLGGSNLHCGESGGAFKRKKLRSETICVAVLLFLLCWLSQIAANVATTMMKLWWNCSEDEIWIEERVEVHSRGKNRNLKQFASLFRCFCCVNCRKLL